MSDLGDQKIGTDVEVKESQANGVLSVEVDLSTPLLDGKLVLGLKEEAVLAALAGKYASNPLVKAAISMLEAAISKIG